MKSSRLILALILLMALGACAAPAHYEHLPEEPKPACPDAGIGGTGHRDCPEG